MIRPASRLAALVGALPPIEAQHLGLALRDAGAFHLFTPTRLQSGITVRIERIRPAGMPGGAVRPREDGFTIIPAPEPAWRRARQ